MNVAVGVLELAEPTHRKVRDECGTRQLRFVFGSWLPWWIRSTNAVLWGSWSAGRNPRGYRHWLLPLGTSV